MEVFSISSKQMGHLTETLLYFFYSNLLSSCCRALNFGALYPASSWVSSRRLSSPFILTSFLLLQSPLVGAPYPASSGVSSLRLSSPFSILIFFLPVAEPSCRSSISSKQLGQLTETLLSIFNSRSFSEQTINACMDRSGFHHLMKSLFSSLLRTVRYRSVGLSATFNSWRMYKSERRCFTVFFQNHFSRYRFDTRNLASKTKYYFGRYR
jgi:hypothetical protein